jgi:low temperature requirement protein LtrA
MPLVTVVIVLIAIGVLLWLVNTYVPMDGKIKQIMNAVVVVAVVLWLLSLFLPLDSVSTLRVGRPY